MRPDRPEGEHSPMWSDADAWDFPEHLREIVEVLRHPNDGQPLVWDSYDDEPLTPHELTALAQKLYDAALRTLRDAGQLDSDTMTVPEMVCPDCGARIRARMS